jgi:hypothetical protein
VFWFYNLVILLGVGPSECQRSTELFSGKKKVGENKRTAGGERLKYTVYIKVDKCCVGTKE